MKSLIIFSFFFLLGIIAYTDYKTKRIPNSIILWLFYIDIVSIFIFPEMKIISRVSGFLGVSFLLSLTFAVRRRAFGGGDIKLMAAGGFFLGAGCTWRAFACGVLCGGVYGIGQIIFGHKNKKDPIAFGPFLCIGMLSAYLIRQRR